MSEHLCHVKVEWLHAVALNEREVCIACRLAYYIQWGTLALGNLPNMFDMLLVDEESHALLTLVGNDFLCREGFVADRQLCHVYLAATLFYKLRETVQMSCRTVVVDADYRVYIFLAEGANQVVGSLLHLRIGTLNGVQLDAVAIATGIY